MPSKKKRRPMTTVSNGEEHGEDSVPEEDPSLSRAGSYPMYSPGTKPLISDHSRRHSEEAEEVQQQWREQQWAEQDQSLAADWQLGTASDRDQPL